MKGYFMIAALVLPATLQAEQADFSVYSVGTNKINNTVFVETISPIPNNYCNDNNLFQLTVDDVDANRFLSVALAAQVQGIKLTIDYDPAICVGDGTAVQIFKLKS
ncbi:MAG: hypothetical protein HQL46_16460 [Gammaproteobacteria bacterium]|nr:hypothetical protein [Gammaproteobacteria bacterium]